jgi:hypothetical protein
MNWGSIAKGIGGAALGFAGGGVLGGALSLGKSLLKPKTNTTTYGPDPATAAYLQAQRAQGQAGANTALNQAGSFFTGPETMSVGDQAAQFMNPYQSQVIDANNAQFDQLRGQASMGANQEAMQAGAFGGSRHGVMAGTRLAQLDQTQMQQNANLLNSGYQNAMQQGVAYQQQQAAARQQQLQEPLWRQQQAMQMMNLGMGPTGQQVTSPGGSALGGAAGGALAGWGATMNPQTGQGNPWGAILGGLGGFFK